MPIMRSGQGNTADEGGMQGGAAGIDRSRPNLAKKVASVVGRRMMRRHPGAVRNHKTQISAALQARALRG